MLTKKKAVCIYHGNCADGFGAAWVVRKAMGDSVEFIPGVYQNAPPDVTGRDVILVDFSYKRSVLIEMAQSAASILILDHHKSAAEDLAGFRENPDKTGYKPSYMAQWAMETQSLPIETVFRLDRSGAMIAWDFFFPEQTPPSLLLYIEDRDLWRFALDGTREIQANLFSYPYDFAVWDRLMEGPVDELRSGGLAIERKHHKDIAELTQVVTRMMCIGGHVIPIANLPYTLTSDAGHLLCGDTYPFAGCYWDTPEGRVFSLRSRDGGADVSKIATQYGGGGHHHAAGFRVSFAVAREMEEWR